MQVITKIFGDVTIDEKKILDLPKGIIGFPDLKKFAIIHDSDKEDSGVAWFQSLDEPAFAMPVMDPLIVMKDYNPIVDDDILSVLGDFKDEDILVLVTMSIPREIKDMTINLKAPIVINASNRKACQIIVDNDDYKIKYPIYEQLKNSSTP